VTEKKRYCTILMAEDDPDDRLIVSQAFLEIGDGWDLHFVEDGEELMDYLHRTGNHEDSLIAPVPDFILLDLNMPKKDGRQALVEIKADSDLKKIPVVIWTTSKELRDKVKCIKTGAEFYVTKPGHYTELIDILRELVSRYCFG
jgi:two-component system, response regulator